MVYSIPDMTLKEAEQISKELSKIVPKNSFTFDFSKVSSLEPLSMLILGSIIRNYMQEHPDATFRAEGLNDYNKHYAEAMGFFDFLSEELITENPSDESCDKPVCIPITPILFDYLQKKEFEQGICLEMGNVIEKEASRLSEVLDRGNAEFHKLLTFLIRELLRNTPEHAKIRNAWICGQNFKNSDITEIAAADEGIGIFKSITSNLSHKSYIKDNADALQWVLKAGISKAFNPSQKQRSDDEWANSGFGLYMVSRICNTLNGSFTIVSGGNYIHMENGQISRGETSFSGTAVKIRLHSDEITDARDIISKTSRKGEEEAKTIRNSFKKSSKPSNGLMNELNIQ